MEAMGHRRWVIAEGWIPDGSTGPAPAMTSHETACMVNTGDEDAHVEVHVLFTDREPAGPYRDDARTRRAGWAGARQPGWPGRM